MSLAAGFDYDSAAVYTVLVDLDEQRWQGFARYDLTCGPGGSLERARRLRDLMPARAAWADAGVVALGLEDTRSRSFLAAAALKRVQGALIACLPRDLPIYALQANVRAGWKVIGSEGDLAPLKANAAKDAIAERARALGAPPQMLQDYYDAFLIARAAARLHLDPRAAAAGRRENRRAAA